MPASLYSPAMSTRTLHFTVLLSVAAGIFLSPGAAADDTVDKNHPLLAVLKQFESAAAKGPDEADLPVRKIPNFPIGTWPGKGLAQHPFLFYGEGNNVLYVVDHGQVVWTYAFPPGGEIDDAWMLTNGHIICTKMTDCYEVTPQKQIVWTYHCPPNTQIHALQPVGLDQVMVVENGEPPHLYILNKKDNSKVLAHELPALSTDPKSIHGQFRNCRITAQGTYLLGFLTGGFINEYDKDWKQIWTCPSPGPWSAVRLKNGNTLIPGDARGFVHEVNPQGQIVWAVESTTLPGIVLHDVQTASRLANGDTLICTRGNASKPKVPAPTTTAPSGTNPAAAATNATASTAPATTPPVPPAPTAAATNAPAQTAPAPTAPPYVVQAVEITPDKKIVWVLQDYQDLPACTGIQLLDEPGTPETPGALER